MLDQPVPGVQPPCCPALEQPPLASRCRRVGLAVDHPVDDEDGIAAQDEPVCSVEVSPHGLSLRAGEQGDGVLGAERGTGRGFCCRNDGILVHVGRDNNRFHSALAGAT